MSPAWNCSLIPNHLSDEIAIASSFPPLPVARESSYLRSLRFRGIDLHCCTEALGSESSDDQLNNDFLPCRSFSRHQLHAPDSCCQSDADREFNACSSSKSKSRQDGFKFIACSSSKVRSRQDGFEFNACSSSKAKSREDGFESEQPQSHAQFYEQKFVTPCKRGSSFPPPISSIARMCSPPRQLAVNIFLPHKSGGRFLLQRLNAYPQNFLRASKKDGRFMLELVEVNDEESNAYENGSCSWEEPSETKVDLGFEEMGFHTAAADVELHTEGEFNSKEDSESSEILPAATQDNVGINPHMEALPTLQIEEAKNLPSFDDSVHGRMSLYSKVENKFEDDSSYKVWEAEYSGLATDMEPCTRMQPERYGRLSQAYDASTMVSIEQHRFREHYDSHIVPTVAVC